MDMMGTARRMGTRMKTAPRRGLAYCFHDACCFPSCSVCTFPLRNFGAPFAFYLVMTIGIVAMTAGVRTFSLGREGEFALRQGEGLT